MGAGWITFAFRRLCGKSLELRVKMKSALPSWAQIQKASSLGSGDVSVEERISMASPRSRIKLMSEPISGGSHLQAFQDFFVFSENII
jgi:hypothetical protein